MLHDSQELPISTASGTAAAAYSRTVASLLKFRLDVRQHMSAMLKADPDFALAHCLKGYLVMLTYRHASVQAAREACDRARQLSGNANPRELLHIEALDAWASGNLDRALNVWERILADYPTDILALWLAHLKYFWLGRARDMLVSVARVAPHWTRDMPGYGALLSCRCFAHEEYGDYWGAEPWGREAVELDPADLWGTHAVAHVMEMQGRQAEGIAWLKGLERHWDGANHITHHLFWHRALFHLERREFDTVLHLYDRSFRNLDSPLTQALPDYHLDVQNAASALFRLERHGIDVGDRWDELADKAEARIGDCLSPFTLPHWMMALAAAGRDQAAQRMLDAMGEASRGGETIAPVIGKIARPVSQAVLAHRRGDHLGAVELMRPVLKEMWRLGGSRAQQDVLHQLFLDAAANADQADDVRLLFARLCAGNPNAPESRIGYAEAAERFLN